MNKRQQRTLRKIFETPTRSDIEWSEVQSLLSSFNADIVEGKGSRVRVVPNNRCMNLHKPHPQKEMRKYAVELVRDFLTVAGVKP